MQTSENINELAAALAVAQGQMGGASKLLTTHSLNLSTLI
jgi:hypothetical protein